MILIDLGNTLAKWRVLAASGDCLSGVDEDNSLPHLRQCLLAHVPMENRIFLATVRREHPLSEIAQEANCELRIVEPQQGLAGLQIETSNLAMMGVDRWLICVALMASQGGGFIVISAGTAITIDVVSEEGRHMGGYIAPGFQLLGKALSANTGRIPEVNLESRLEPGHSTQSAVSAGVTAMFSGFVKEVVARHTDSHWPVIVCGGDAAKIVGELAHAQHREGLVLDGLRYLAQHADTP